METLYIVATPVGNLEDITVRAVKVLLSVAVIACEDTRRTGMLINLLKERYGASMINSQILPRLRSGQANPKYISVRDWNEAEMVEGILQELELGDVALVSDAGTPLISDPGYKIVRKARELGFRVVPIPGPSAAIAALSVSGLPTNKFIFLGFLGKRWDLMPGYTYIIYESPVRADKSIRSIVEKYPSAQVVVAQELTKIHESVESYREGMKFKGEVTILVYLAI